MSFRFEEIKVYLETSGTPIDKIDRALGFDVGNGCIDILGDHIATVEQAYRHVFACFRVAFDHLVVGFEARVGDLRHRHFFMIGFFSRDDRTESR